MKTEYNGIEITYNENDNEWHFVLRGRSRSAESLAKAKEAIDKEPAEKRKPFPRFDAYMLSYKGFDKVTVTSLADGGWRNETMYWIQRDDHRRKEKGSSLYQINEHNEQLLVQIREKEAAIDKLQKEATSLREQMQTITPPENL